MAKAQAKKEEILKDFSAFKLRMRDKLTSYTKKYRKTAPVVMLEQAFKGITEELKQRAMAGGRRIGKHSV
jgi:hypothetical protein